jgi:RHS repeat-associated protein
MGTLTAKSENGVTTNYVVAVLSLSQVLFETTGGSTTRYAYGHDLLAEYDGTEWTCHLNDGLGSVRQLADASGALTLAQGYTPFGVPLWSDGNGSTGYGFTGERWKAYAELLFLRARYYEPGTGRFSQKDPWSGDFWHPDTLNGWDYSKSNPISLLDRSGYFPTLSDIDNGLAEFTCNCGWIDWKHVRKSDELAYGLVDDLKFIANNFYPDPGLNDNWAIYTGIPLGLGPVEFDLFSEYAVVPHGEMLLQDSGRVALAVSVFMDANEGFENKQGSLPWAIVPWLRNSYYSEEDLPSDIIGFYVGLHRYTTPTSYDALIKEVRDRCGAVGRDDSHDVFVETYSNGNKAITGWNRWYPRCAELVGSNACLCENGSRTWPSEFKALTSLRVPPSPDGSWWWYTGGTDDGFLVPTERPRIFRMSSDLRPPTPPALAP